MGRQREDKRAREGRKCQQHTALSPVTVQASHSTSVELRWALVRFGTCACFSRRRRIPFCGPSRACDPLICNMYRWTCTGHVLGIFDSYMSLQLCYCNCTMAAVADRHRGGGRRRPSQPLSRRLANKGVLDLFERVLDREDMLAEKKDAREDGKMTSPMAGLSTFLYGALEPHQNPRGPGPAVDWLLAIFSRRFARVCRRQETRLFCCSTKRLDRPGLRSGWRFPTLHTTTHPCLLGLSRPS